MNDNTELFLWIFGITSFALLGLLFSVLYYAYDSKARRNGRERPGGSRR